MLLSALFCVLKIKQAQDEERRQLIQLRDILKSALQVEQKEVSRFNFERLLFSHLWLGGFGSEERDIQILQLLTVHSRALSASTELSVWFLSLVL